MAGTSKIATASLDWRAGLSELWDQSLNLAGQYAGSELKEKYQGQYPQASPAVAQTQPAQGRNLVLYAVIGIVVYFGFKAFKTL